MQAKCSLRPIQASRRSAAVNATLHKTTRLYPKVTPVPHPWTIRAIHDGDASTVSHHRYVDHASQDDLTAYAAWITAAIQRGNYVGLVAETGYEVIAGAGLLLLEWGPTRGDPNPIRGRIVNVWTHPEWRRRGIATDLVQRLLGQAEKIGIRTIGLGSTPMSEALYRSLGFEQYLAEMIRRPR
jgi:GNAT superfamily N-acetyltransferase